MRKNYYSLLIKVFNLIFVFVLGLSLGIGTKIIFAAEDELKVGSKLNLQGQYWIYGLPTSGDLANHYAAPVWYVNEKANSAVSGPANRVVKYRSDETGLTESTIYDNGAAVGIGTTSPVEDLHVYRGDTDVARVYVTGSNQGTGMVYVGQSPFYGGGIVYNGDDNPDLPFSTDYVSLFRRNNGTDYEVAHWHYGSNTVYFNGDIIVQSSDVYDNSGNLRLNAEDNLYLSMDYNNNDSDTRAIMFGKNDEGGDGSWTELMRIQEDGRIGIGTTAPSNKLTVKGATEVYQNVYVRGTLGSAAEQIRIHNNNVNTYIDYHGGHVYFRDEGSSTKLFIQDSTGYIGIGTTNPGSKLEVAGQISADSGYIVNNLNVSTGDLIVGGSDLFVDNSAGRVGIGTASPQSLLHVYNGFIKLNGTDSYIGHDTAHYVDPYVGTLPDGSHTGMRFSVYGATNRGFWFGDYNDTAPTLWISPNESGSSSRRVGIGTVSPKESLHVYDSSGSSAIFLGGNSTGGPHGIVFDDDTSGSGVQLFYRTSPNQLILEKSSAGTGTDGADVFLYDRDTDYFFFNGKVGIGTTSTMPIGTAYKLAVSGRMVAGSGTIANGLVYCNGGITLYDSYLFCNSPYVAFLYLDSDTTPDVLPLSGASDMTQGLMACFALGAKYYTGHGESSTQTDVAYYNLNDGEWQIGHGYYKTWIECSY